MKFKLSILLSLIIIANSFSQEKLDLDLSNSCSFNGAPITGEIYGFASSNEAVQIIDEIVDHIGLKRNFKIQAGTVPNAAATIKPGNNGEYDRYILYSQNFMSNIINETNSYWSAIGIMAHEVAHHLNGHTLKGSSRPPTELEADEFAGFVLYKMGATLEQAQSMFNNRSMYMEYDSQTHPATSARLEAVAVGYQKSKEKSRKSEVSKLPSNRTSNYPKNNNTRNNYPTNRTNYPNNGNNYPNTNTTKTSYERLTSDDVQFITTQINGQNIEFEIIKDKRLLLVTSKNFNNRGEQNVTTLPIGNFTYYEWNDGTKIYYAYYNTSNTYGTLETYQISIWSDNGVHIELKNETNSRIKIGNLKFNWF